jgi:hypothetical protein
MKKFQSICGVISRTLRTKQKEGEKEKPPVLLYGSEMADVEEKTGIEYKQ